MNFLTFLTVEWGCETIQETIMVLILETFGVLLLEATIIFTIEDLVKKGFKSDSKQQIEEILDDFIFDVNGYEDFDIFTPLKDQES